MKTALIGAVSLAALAVAACGQKADTTYETTEAPAAEETTVAEAEPYTSETMDTVDADDAYADTSEYSAGSTVGQTGGLTGGQWINASAIATKEDINTAADTAFAKADANLDGVIDRTEFMRVAAGPSAYVSGPVAPADEMDPMDPMAPTDPSAMDTTTTAENDPAITGEPAGVDTMTPGATTGQVVSAETDTMFADIAGDDDEVTKEGLREALLERFEQADANGDSTLDNMEREEFVRLTMIP